MLQWTHQRVTGTNQGKAPSEPRPAKYRSATIGTFLREDKRLRGMGEFVYYFKECLERLHKVHMFPVGNGKGGVFRVETGRPTIHQPYHPGKGYNKSLKGQTDDYRGADVVHARQQSL